MWIYILIAILAYFLFDKVKNLFKKFQKIFLDIFNFFNFFFSFFKIRSSFKISEFKNKTILITGCDTGFGYLASKKFDSLGFKVISACLTEEGAQKLKKETSNKLVTVLMDVSKEDSIK